MPAERHIFRDGIIVGLIGYAAVALFYSAFDFVAARGALHTVNMLGRAVFRGLRDPSVLQFPIDFDPDAIFAYNAVHLVAALAIGLMVTWLTTLAEARAAWRPFIRFVIIAGFVVTVIGVGLLTMPLRDVVPWWSIIVANAAATALAAAYLLSRHPGLWRRLALSQA
jgi:hypothetical protein